MLKALDAAAVSLRSRLGESLSSVEKYATPVEEATTPSLEALKAYSLGWKPLLERGRRSAAVPQTGGGTRLEIRRMLHRHVADLLDLCEFRLSAENARKAYDLRQKVSERERFVIEANYYWTGSGELEKAAQAIGLWQKTYPRDSKAYDRLAVVSMQLGNLEEALEQLQQATRLEQSMYLYDDLGLAYFNLNRLDEAEAVFEKAEKQGGSESLVLFHYMLAFLRGDDGRMAHLASVAVGKPGRKTSCWLVRRTPRVGTAG